VKIHVQMAVPLMNDRSWKGWPSSNVEEVDVREIDEKEEGEAEVRRFYCELGREDMRKITSGIIIVKSDNFLPSLDLK